MEEIRKIVFWIAGIILSLIIVSIIFLTYSISMMKLPLSPNTTVSSNTSEQEAKTKEIANYKQVVEILQWQKTNVYDFIVIRTLLPLFNYFIASILAFVFAKSAYEIFQIYYARKKGG
ncbi:hypothetical protein [Ferruginibacter sp. SUN106]|uniref:hypothetical protein n=1 Tax=Ferruginibacter sp. SUN106 TaxID=2978348 RepID=UPI003D35F5A4